MIRLLVLLVLVGCASPDDNLNLKVQDTSPPPDIDIPQVSIAGCFKTFHWTNPTEDVASNPLLLSDLSHGIFYFNGDYEWQEQVTMPVSTYQTVVWEGYWTAHLTMTHINGAESAPSNTVEGVC